VSLSDSGAAALAARALAYVRPGQVIGLGSGQAATAFVHALGRELRAGLRVTGVPTSEATATLARELGIPLASLEDSPSIDMTIDGADEVDPSLDLIKGYGGALTREKVVAAASRQLLILVGGDKLVPALGSRGKLPVEVVPFAAGFCRRRLADEGYPPLLRKDGAIPVVTDNANLIFDCAVGPIGDAMRVDGVLRSIPGVVGTGLFIGMAHTVLVWHEGRITTMSRAEARPEPHDRRLKLEEKGGLSS
jgi:ribose 5-phosphate isomerase A